MPRSQHPSPVSILTDAKLVIPEVSDDLEGGIFVDDGSDGDRSLQAERRAIIYEFEYEDGLCFLVVGLYDDGTPAELLVTLPGQSPDTQHQAQMLAQTISVGLQHNVPLQNYTEYLLRDYDPLWQSIAKWLDHRFSPTQTTSLDSLSKPTAIDITETEA